MADWTAVIGAIGGVVGAATGIIGAYTGIASSRKVDKMTLLDFRIKHGDVYTTIQVKLDSIRELAPKADKSRIARLAAQGMAQSGAMEKWKTDYNEHIKNINALSHEFRSFTAENTSLESEKLTSELHGMGLILKRIDALNESLKESIAEDDVARGRIADALQAYRTTR